METTLTQLDKYENNCFCVEVLWKMSLTFTGNLFKQGKILFWD